MQRAGSILTSNVIMSDNAVGPFSSCCTADKGFTGTTLAGPRVLLMVATLILIDASEVAQGLRAQDLQKVSTRQNLLPCFARATVPLPCVVSSNLQTLRPIPSRLRTKVFSGSMSEPSAMNRTIACFLFRPRHYCSLQLVQSRLVCHGSLKRATATAS